MPLNFVIQIYVIARSAQCKSCITLGTTYLIVGGSTAVKWKKPVHYSHTLNGNNQDNQNLNCYS